MSGLACEVLYLIRPERKCVIPKLKRGALDRRRNREGWPRRCDGLAGHTIKLVVVVRRIVMEQHDLLDLSERGEVQRVFQRAMAPADMCRIFVAAVLRVVDQ